MKTTHTELRRLLDRAQEKEKDKFFKKLVQKAKELEISPNSLEAGLDSYMDHRGVWK